MVTDRGNESYSLCVSREFRAVFSWVWNSSGVELWYESRRLRFRCQERPSLRRGCGLAASARPAGPRPRRLYPDDAAPTPADRQARGCRAIGGRRGVLDTEALALVTQLIRAQHALPRAQRCARVAAQR